MRVLLGLAALAALPSAQATLSVTPTTGTQNYAQYPPVGWTALSTISIFANFAGNSQVPVTVTPNSLTNVGAGSYSSTSQQSANWAVEVPYYVSTLVFVFTTNQYVGQAQYRWYPDYAPQLTYPTLSQTSYTCDPCAGGTPVSCNTSVGPGGTPSPANGYPCSGVTRTYTLSTLYQSVTNSFSVQLFDIVNKPAPNVSSYSFVITRDQTPVFGDPMIYGIQGQDFQVHGIPDEIFNLISAPTLQVNARFVYLSQAECVDNYTACFAHPGTYISEEGIRVGSTDRVHIKAGSATKGLTVKINGQKLTSMGRKELKSGSVELINHRRVVVSSDVAVLTVTNSDKFLNQEAALVDQSLIEKGKLRRKLLVGESLYPEVPLHGLQGQTWRNVEYPSGLEYEGTIEDYHVTDGNLFGTHFHFNKYNVAN